MSSTASMLPTPSMVSASRAASKPLPKLDRKERLCSLFASFGLNKDINLWVQSTDLPDHVDQPQNAIGIIFKPEILGKMVSKHSDISHVETNRTFQKAIKFSFPCDATVIVQDHSPNDKFHLFSMQDGEKPFYGVVITTWNRLSDSKRRQLSHLKKRIIFESVNTKNSTASTASTKDLQDPDAPYWIPTASVLISQYPLYNLLGDYLKALLVSDPDTLHGRLTALLDMSLPRAGDHIRLELGTYALFFQFPGVGIPFRNFNLWPFFSCLSAQNILSILETALSPRGRVIIYSRNLHMLALSCEALGVLLESSGWHGHFVPIMPSRSIQSTLEHDQGPYIVGIPTECRYVAAPPNVNTITVDVDINYAFASRPVKVFGKQERIKYLRKLQEVTLNNGREFCIPEEFIDAYPNDQLIPLGPMLLAAPSTQVRRFQQPPWWKEEAVLPVVESIVRGDEKPLIKKLFCRKTCLPSPTRDLEAVLRERNAYQADVQEAWIEYCALKDRLDNEIHRVNKRNTFLLDEVTNWKEAFSRFETFAKRLTVEATDMKGKIEEHRLESRRLSSMLDQQKSEAAMLDFKLKDTEKERDKALKMAEKTKTLLLQIQWEKDSMQSALREYQSNYDILSVERQEANRIVGEIKDVMSGKSNDLQNVLQSLNNAVSEEKLKRISCMMEIGRLENVQEEEELEESTQEPVQLDQSTASNRNQKRFSTTSRCSTTSRISLLDPVDKLMREKTDAIADIIRSIQGSCNEAVKVLDEKEQRLSQIPSVSKLPDTPISSQPSSPIRELQKGPPDIAEDMSEVSSCDIALTHVGASSEFGSTLVGDGENTKHASDEEEDFVRFKFDLARKDAAHNKLNNINTTETQRREAIFITYDRGVIA